MASILIVDDNSGERQRLDTLLSSHGNTVRAADDIAQALALCRLVRPDVIVTDVLMPGHDGFELLHQLRSDKTLMNIPTIFYTAYYQESNARAFADACGVVCVLPKSADSQTILDAVDSALVHPPPVRAKMPTGEFDHDHTSILKDRLFASIVELEATNASLRVSEQQLRGLAARSRSALEEERTRIARHLHDELGQALTVLKMNCDWVAKHIETPSGSVLERLQSSIQIADETIVTVRQLATELRPGILDLGIAAAIEWQAEEFQTRSEVSCVLDLCDGDELVDPPVATQIFRIFQETMTNIARHAEATLVHISLHCDGAELALEVRDNGKGVTPGQLAAHDALGLLGMHERASLVGGTLTIGTSPEGGTVVRVCVPAKPAFRTFSESADIIKLSEQA